MISSSFSEYMWLSFLAKFFHTSIQTVWAIQTAIGIVVVLVFTIVYLLIIIRR